jgi:hypothetical protein
VSHWSEVATEAWVAPLLDWEETQRACRSLFRPLLIPLAGSWLELQSNEAHLRLDWQPN